MPFNKVLFTNCSPKVNPEIAIFCGILAVNIDDYSLQPKTLNLTPSELMTNAARFLFIQDHHDTNHNPV